MSLTGFHLRMTLRRLAVTAVDVLIALLEDDPAPAETPAPAPEAPTPAAKTPAPPKPQAPPPKQDAPLPPLPQVGESVRQRPLMDQKPPRPESAEERQARHQHRTRMGLLRFVAEAGGQTTLADLHEHSASTYFVAHIVFSRMMEKLTDEGLLAFDHDTSVASLTAKGREALDANA